MRHLRNLFAIVISMFMMMTMGTTAFAATQTTNYTGSGGDGATITINNPAKGETYNVYKLFDATVTDDGKIAYQGADIPSSLNSYFVKDNAGYIYPTESIADQVVKDAEGNVTEIKTTTMTDALLSALENWANTAPESMLISSAESDGKETLQFTNLPYGYYVITTTHKSDPQGEQAAKSAITVTSTQPNASVYDKNVNEPSATKEVEYESYSIGDTVKYTATFDTTNYIKDDDGNSRQVVSYVIKDTLPNYLGNVTVKSITIGGEAQETVQFNNDKTITITWATKDGDKYTSLYSQGAKIVIKYEAVLTSTTNINKADKNTIGITPWTVSEDGTQPEGWEHDWHDSAEITTYAAALKKTDGENALSGAEFTVKGLIVEQTDPAVPGVYTVVSYNNAENASESGILKTDENGKLYIIGLASNVELIVTETKAPDGYNKLTETKTLKPQVLEQQIYVTDGYEKYDADGNLIDYKAVETAEYTRVTQNLNELDTAALEIENKTGTVLPSTGGIGTTIFYIVGGVMVAGAVVFLLTKRRMVGKE